MRFNVTATVGISITATVEADSPEEARKIARDLQMPGLCYQCARDDRDDGAWCVSELDGEARDIRVTASNEE